MGLDQFWLREQTKEEKAIALLEGKPTVDKLEFGYHREYQALQEAVRPFLREGIEGEVDDTFLHYALQFAIQENDKELMKIIKEAKKFIDKGIKVTYYASW